MTTDTDRDAPVPAALASGLPHASTERWQPLRSGLVNIYHYDYQEFHYEQGRLLLRGNNGTGKSRVLALQLPFLLDGEVSPSRLEPDADPAKRIEWNLLLGGKYNDRLGYTWLELGRINADGTEEYCTVGCGLRAVEGRGSPDKWFFITEKRIGGDLFLQAREIPLTRDRLIDAIGDKGEVFLTAIKYRDALDRKLFQLGPHRYDALVNLLIQLRQPQLSRDLNERKLSDALSEALPPLPQTIIANLAEAFRSLESDRIALDSFVRAQQSVNTFLTAYQRYAQIAARRRANNVTEVEAKYSNAKRELAAAKRTLSGQETAAQTLAERIHRLNLRSSRAGARVQTLEDSSQMRDVRSLDEARRKREEHEAEAERAEEELRRASELRAEKDSKRADRASTKDASRASLKQALARASTSAAAAVMNRTHGSVIGPLELVDGIVGQDVLRRAKQRIAEASERQRRSVDQLRKLQKVVDTADNALARAKHTQSAFSEQLDRALEQQLQRRSQFDAAVLELDEAYKQWVKSVGELTPADSATVAQALKDWQQDPVGKSPTVLAVESAVIEANERIANARASLSLKHGTVEQNLKELEIEKISIVAGDHQGPPVPHTRNVADRLDRRGGPLWQLCDFAPGLSDDGQAGLEAALEASGLLDAWVTPEGQLLSLDEHDTVLAVGTSPLPESDHHAGNLLAVDTTRSELMRTSIPDKTISDVLRHIGLGDDSGSVWVDTDGRWKLGPLHGKWRKPATQYIGPAARAAERQRQLDRVTNAISQAEMALDKFVREENSLDERGRRVKEEAQTAPTDAKLHRAQADVAAANEAVSDARQRVSEAETEVSIRRRAADAAAQDLGQTAASAGLSDRLGHLESVLDALHEYERAIDALWSSVDSHNTERDLAADAVHEAAKASEEEQRRQEILTNAQRRVVQSEAEFEALQEASGASADEVLAKLSEARAESELIRNHLDEAIAERERTLRSAGATEEAIRVQTEALASAEQRRSQASEELRIIVDTRLHEIADPDLASILRDGKWSENDALSLAEAIEQTLEDEDDDSNWERIQNGLYPRFNAFQEALLPGGYSPAIETRKSLIVVTVPFQGRDCTVVEFQKALTDEITSRSLVLSAREREVLENHLIGEVSVQLHDLLHRGEELVNSMNQELARRPTSTGMALRFSWRPVPDGPDGLVQARKRLFSSGDTWSRGEREDLGAFLQQQIRSERQNDETRSWQEHLASALDYRKWHVFTVERRQDGQWIPLTRRTHGTGSGGEKAIALTIPQFAAAAAHYRTASPNAPRLILLDEAFAGIDNDMRSKCMDLLRAFDLDFVMTSEREWGCYPTVPGLAIYQLSARPGIDAVGVSQWVWNGRVRLPVEEKTSAREAPDATVHDLSDSEGGADDNGQMRWQ